MMKLFGTNKNRAPGGADNGGLGHETELKLGVIPEDEVDNMKPTKEWNDIKSTTNKNKTPEQKLMESMLLVATKIRQYEELLYNETILRNEDVDTLSLEAMVRRYANQVRVADAICSKGCAVVEDAAYRRYADSFRSYIREPNLSLCFKKSPPTDENIAKKEKDKEELLSESGMHKTDADDDDKIGNRVIPTPRQAGHSEKYGTVDVPPPQTLEPLPTLNATDSHIINCTEKLSLCEKCSPRVASSGVEEVSCTADSDAATPRFRAIESVTPKSSHTKPKRKGKQRPGIYNVGSDQDIVDAPAEYQNRYAVFKTRSIQRLPVANLFDTPTPESSHVLMSPRSTVRDITNSHNNTNFLAAGDAAEDAVPWMNKSKSANESWYEFKERCSRSNNNSFVNSPPSRNFPVHGTFHVKDSPNYESTVRIAQKKFVRFSVSPIKSSSRRAHYIPSDSSSDEDDLQFEVDQFPCVYKSYQKSPHSRNHH